MEKYVFYVIICGKNQMDGYKKKKDYEKLLWRMYSPKVQKSGSLSIRTSFLYKQAENCTLFHLTSTNSIARP